MPSSLNRATPVVILFGLLFVPAMARADDAPEAFGIRSRDHISIIGNTLADRMQHDGWLETYLHSRYPRHELVIRNLGFSGDELTLRLRSASFGSPDKWLSFDKSDVVMAFFGYNESFKGEAGLDKFKKDLDDFIKHMVKEKYNGKTPPRFVLFSPIAHENLHDRNLPDGSENNKRLALYTEAMAQIAKANGVRFVDLYKPTLDLYARAKQPLTINGVHLNEEGNRQLAQVIDRALFGSEAEPKRDDLDKLRRAVLDKNFFWFNRYRTVDGYSMYGGRADLRFVDGQTNRVVMDRELEVLDQLTANRDKRIWAAAQGQDLPIDDSNTPPFIPVKTNKPGTGPQGTHIFVDPEDAIKQMTVAKGMKVNLFASEKDFPELEKPVQMAWDTRGRLWVAVWPSYPHWKPKEEMNDKILIFEDTDGDGKADKCTVFADHLHCPTGFEFYNGGVLVAQAPDIMFLKDTKGTGKADLRIRVLSGMDSADTHHTSNSFTLDPGGAMYWQEGTFHHTQVESPYGPSQRCANAGVFRYEPRSQKFDVYVTFGFANPHGHIFDRWGQDIVTDGTGSQPYHAALFSGHLDYPQKHARPPQVYQQRTRPCPAIEILSSRHFPDENQGNLLVGNVIAPTQGILQYKIQDNGASFIGTEVETIVSSTDPSFRPSDIKIGPDGAIYFLDWINPIIGHMQHNLRDPSRDRTHGRIYRVSYPGRPTLRPVAIAGEPIEKLLDVLKEPEDRVRYRARIELGGRETDQVIPAAKKWIAGLDKSDKDYEHHVLEGLWVHQYHNVVDVDLLKRVLASSDFRARAAAAHVLCYWRDRVPDALDLFKKLAADQHPRVRLEAIRAASFFTEPEALEVVLISAEHPSDGYLDFVRGETMKALDPIWRKAVADGRPINFTSDAGARYFLKSVSTDDLLKLKRSKAVFLELLLRRGVRDEFRREALAGLAKLDNKSELRVLLDAIEGLDQNSSQEEGVFFDLVRLLTARNVSELAGVRGELEKLATGAKLNVTRELGFVALIAADASVDKAWALAVKTVPGLTDLVTAMPLIRDPGLRAVLYPKVEPLLNGLPAELAATQPRNKGIMGRFVRIELPGRNKTLTLAEVEVYSDGRNVARQGKATQKNTSNGGDAAKAIDGNKSGIFRDGGQTHTEEGTSNPWWEVDLGAEFAIDSIAIYNRTEDNLGKRLEGYTLRVSDGAKKTVFEQRRNPAPAVKAEFAIGGGTPETMVRRAAMNGLTSVRGQEGPTFKALARFIKDGTDRHAAIQAISRIPVAYWPPEEAKPLLDSIAAYIAKLPTSDRTSPAALDALQLGDNLASLLPLPEAKKVRQQLGELGVRVIRMATVPDQMLFDKERIAVRAGKPVEIVFENNDLMPHNFVLTMPGALEEIGTTAEAAATQPGAVERHFVPQSPKVLFSSRLLQPRESQKLSFTAPLKPGVYPYVCTYPGHWRRMYGALYVVDDLDDYLADAEAYLAKHPLPPADELLKFNRPRKEWKFDELDTTVKEMQTGRSFANGKQMFQVATCVACHKLNGVGNEFGPDLTKLDPKLTIVDILKDVIEPSFRINEKYFTYTINMNNGKAYTGIILEEKNGEIKLIENPLTKAEPITLKVADIAERTKSETSMMPKGLLDKLTKEEILDLIAYVASKGDEKHKLFQPEAGHEHKH